MPTIKNQRRAISKLSLQAEQGYWKRCSTIPAIPVAVVWAFHPVQCEELVGGSNDRMEEMFFSTEL